MQPQDGETSGLDPEVLHRWPLRFGLFWLGAFVMVYPEWLFKAIGAAVFVAVFLLERNLSDQDVDPMASPTGDD